MELNKIYNMDCLEGMKQLKDNSIDLILTDPPYSTPVVTAFGRKKVLNVADLSIQEGYFKILKIEFERILKQEGRVFIFCDDKYYPILFRVFYDWGKTRLVVWDKKRINMGSPFRKRHELIFYVCRESYNIKNKGIPSILEFSPVGQERIHGAQKPLELISFLVENFTEENNIVLDPFLGSGSTALACKQLNRRFIGFELNKEYFDIANKRLAQEVLL